MNNTGIHPETLIDSPLNALARVSDRNSRRWFPHQYHDPTWPFLQHLALGVAGEAGEVAQIIKKATGYAPDDPRRGALDQKLAEEIGDCLAYLFSIAGALDLDIDRAYGDVIDKCEARWVGAPNR